ncbi:MAG: MBL fold metallo-hydrolase [Synergistaceae bacterium]|nr:MBL fold metallo-hydrolase [Synergistaceae bacterium]
MIYDYGNGIYGVDSYYEGREFAEIFILRGGGRAAVVESAHNASLPRLLSALDELGIARGEIDYLCLTHVHLDHAGGAGSYMREFPNARLLLHPRGARHMIDPAKLVEGVRAVYGAAETERMYGEIIPVPEARVTAPRDGEEFSVGEFTLACYDAPGHARHHMIFFEKKTKSLFAGDAFGISFPWMEGAAGRWAFPSTSPVQFDPEAMIATTERILSLRPDSVYITHFGRIAGAQAERVAASLIESVKKYTRLAEEKGGDKDKIKSGLLSLYRRMAEENGIKAAEAPKEPFLIDSELNAQGIAFWYKSANK